MKLIVEVRAENFGIQLKAGMVVPNPFVAAFHPVRTTDCATLAYATGDVLDGSEVQGIKYKLREDASKFIAAELAKHLVEIMEKQDTYNGYPIVK